MPSTSRCACLRLHPDDPEVLYHSGRLFANFAYLQTMRLAAVAPDSVWLHLAAGEANESQGLYDAALREYPQVLEVAPRRPGIHLRIGRMLLHDRTAMPRPKMLADATRRGRISKRARPRSHERERRIRAWEMHRKAGARAARVCSSRPCRTYPGFEAGARRAGRTLIALGRPADVLHPSAGGPEAQSRERRRRLSDRAAYRALGKSAEQEKALAKFNRLRSLAERRPPAARDKAATSTPQVLDASR